MMNTMHGVPTGREAMVMPVLVQSAFPIANFFTAIAERTIRAAQADIAKLDTSVANCKSPDCKMQILSLFERLFRPIAGDKSKLCAPRAPSQNRHKFCVAFHLEITIPSRQWYLFQISFSQSKPI